MSKFIKSGLVQFFYQLISFVVVFGFWVGLISSVSSVTYILMLGYNANLAVYGLYLATMLPINGLLAAFAFKFINRRGSKLYLATIPPLKATFINFYKQSFLLFKKK